eukprot:6473658-Prorocentrum_lima.AAC.1
MGHWLDDYIHKLDFGVILGALLEPRTVLTVLRGTMEPVASKDELLRKAMREDLSLPQLRNPQSMEIVS